MPLFVMIAHDGPDGPRARDANRDAHVANLEAMDSEGRIAFGGPIRTDDGSRSNGAVIVFTAPDLESARETMASDPYTSGGVYESWTVSPFKLAFPR